MQGEALPLRERGHGRSGSATQRGVGARRGSSSPTACSRWTATIAPSSPTSATWRSKYHAIVVVDDCHATGFMGNGGRGTHEHAGRHGSRRRHHRHARQGAWRRERRLRSGRAAIIAWLRQRSRPYLFSNTIAPAVAATTLAVLDLLESSPPRAGNSRRSLAWFRARLTADGFRIVPGEHPIIPVMIGDAALAVRVADRLLGSASTRSASRIRSCRWARRASARRCARRTRARCSRRRPRHLRKRDGNSASSASEEPMQALIKSRREPGIWLGELPKPEPGPSMTC